MQPCSTRIVLGCAAKAAIVLLVLGAGTSLAADSERWPLPPELWDRPRSGAAIISAASVKQAIGALVSRPAARLTIRHPPGAESTLQAEELRAWLIAHAVEPARIVLRADLAPRSPLQMEIGH